MRAGRLLAAALGVYVQGGGGGEVAIGATLAKAVELVLPRPAQADEAVWLRVRVGVLSRGTEIRILADDGTLLGTVSPFAAPRGLGGVSHVISLPKAVVAKGRVRLRLEVNEPGTPVRAPAPGEIERLELIYVPVTK